MRHWDKTSRRDAFHAFFYCLLRSFFSFLNCSFSRTVSLSLNKIYTNSFPVFFVSILNGQIPLLLPRWFIVIFCHRWWKEIYQVHFWFAHLYKSNNSQEKNKTTEAKSYFSLLSYFPKLFWGKEERQQQSDYASTSTSHEKHNIQIQSD